MANNTGKPTYQPQSQATYLGDPGDPSLGPVSEINGGYQIPGRGVLGNVLHGAGHVAGGALDIALHPGQNPFGSGGGKSAPKMSDAEKFHQTLTAAGYTPEQAATLVSRYNQQVAKAQALKGLPKEFAGLISAYDQELAQPQQSQQSGSILDPLAMQAFFSQTIAPYLQQTGQQLRDTVSQGNAKINLNSLPPAYRNIMSQAMDMRKQGVQNLTSALQGATVAAPFLDRLNQQLGAATQAQDYDRYIREREMAYNQAGGLNGLLGSTTPGASTTAAISPTGSQLDQIKKILGG